MATYSHNSDDLTILMTANDAPSPNVASASDEEAPVYSAYKAFIHSVEEIYWGTNASPTGWLKFDFGNGNEKTVGKYTVSMPHGDMGIPPGECPKTWTFQGSNNDAAWTTLDTQTDVPGWSNGEMRTYEFTNSTAYRYYRINITANQGGDLLFIGELEMMPAPLSVSLSHLKTDISAIWSKYWLNTDIAVMSSGYSDNWLKVDIQAKAEAVINLKTSIEIAYKFISDLKTFLDCQYPTRKKFLLLRHDHIPARNAQNVKTGKAMQFRLYNLDTAFGIDIISFKLRFDGGAWYRYGDSRLTFTEVSYRECKVYFNPPNFLYDREIMIEVYCEDHLNNPGIKLEIL